MATYKVIQDVEAEDTIVGPLTLRQLIYAAIAALSAYACVLSVQKGVTFLIIFFLPFLAFGAFFAFPWSKQQPTEVWALAKVRFYFKPRKRIWDQSGAKELVTITAPKTIERHLTNGLSPYEVESRLKALADTIDTRGWAIKNVGVSNYSPFGAQFAPNSDRLVTADNLPQEVPNYDTTTVVDVLDDVNNPRVKQLDQMMAASATAQRQKIVTQISQPQPTQAAVPSPNPGQAVGIPTQNTNSTSGDASYWYLNHPVQASAYGAAGAAPAAPIAATPTEQEIEFAKRLKQQSEGLEPASYSHMRTIQPVSAEPQTTIVVPAVQIPLPPVTAPINSATLELANNNDLSVAAIAREAQRMNPGPSDEVIVSLR